MIVVDKKNIVMGSNAVKSQALPKQNPEVYKKRKVKKQAHEYVQEHRAFKKRRNIKTFSMIGFAFLLGMATIARTNSLYQNQKVIEGLKNDIKSQQFYRDSLKIDTKGYSLKELENLSVQYGMKEASKNEFTYVDLSKDYFDLTAGSQISAKEGFFNKLVDLLF